MHLLLPFANSASPACRDALPKLKLPHLEMLLRKLPMAHTDAVPATSLSPPHERAMAASFGMAAPDGQIPWGAWHAAQAGLGPTQAQAWSVITPCHWAVQTQHITMDNPRALNLTKDESQALLDAMQGYFAGDGITLTYDTPTRWLAHGAVFEGLATASPYRAIGHAVDDWIARAPAAKTLRRLQQEMQMLLYNHQLTEARAARGLPAVNSFWVSGTGSTAHALQPSAPGKPLCPTDLRDAAVRDDGAQWAAAWQKIDATLCAELLQHLRQNPGASSLLTLCGDQTVLQFSNQPLGSLGQLQFKLKALFNRQSVQTVLAPL